MTDLTQLAEQVIAAGDRFECMKCRPSYPCGHHGESAVGVDVEKDAELLESAAPALAREVLRLGKENSVLLARELADGSSVSIYQDAIKGWREENSQLRAENEQLTKRLALANGLIGWRTGEPNAVTELERLRARLERAESALEKIADLTGMMSAEDQSDIAIATARLYLAEAGEEGG